MAKYAEYSSDSQTERNTGLNISRLKQMIDNKAADR